MKKNTFTRQDSGKFWVFLRFIRMILVTDSYFPSHFLNRNSYLYAMVWITICQALGQTRKNN